MNDLLCPVCRAADLRLINKRIAEISSEPSPYLLMVCQRCRVYSLFPRPTTVGEVMGLYPDDYEPHRVRGGRWGEWQIRRLNRLRVSLLRRAVPAGGKLMDVGAGIGGFLEEMRLYPAWVAEGIDINRHAVSYSQSLGLPVRLADISTTDFGTSRYDAITMWEVIEHVSDPLGVMATIRRALKPEGPLFMSTPNADGLSQRIWGRYWQGWEFPRHLQVFSRTSLTTFLNTNGFSVRRFHVLPVERYYWTQSMLNCLEDRISGARSNRALAALTQFSAFAFAPLCWLIDLHPLASNLVVEAIRE